MAEINAPEVTLNRGPFLTLVLAETGMIVTIVTAEVIRTGGTTGPGIETASDHVTAMMTAGTIIIDEIVTGTGIFRLTGRRSSRIRDILINTNPRLT